MYLPGVGPHKKELLSKELGVKSWGDLLAYFPYKYVDRSHIYPIRELTADMPFVQIRARILSYEEYEMGPRKKRVVGHASDGMGVVDLVWFSGAQYVYKNYKVGEEFIIFGKPTVYGGRIQIAHPDMDRVEDLQLSQMGLQPYYSTTELMKKRSMTSRTLEKIVKAMLDKLQQPIDETLPPFITTPLHLVSRDQALRGIHNPHNPKELQDARLRLSLRSCSSSNSTSCVTPPTTAASIKATFLIRWGRCSTPSTTTTCRFLSQERRSASCTRFKAT